MSMANPGAVQAERSGLDFVRPERHPFTSSGVETPWARTLRGGLPLLGAALIALAAGCKGQAGAAGGGGKPRGPLAYPVETRVVELRPVEYALSAVGSVEAFERVQITARVAGVVEQVRFTEGQQARKGTVLVEIDPARYRLAARAAKAELEKAKAAKEEAAAGAARRAEANEKSPGLIRGEEIDAWRTKARSAEAEAIAAQVALEQAELNLADAYVRAPIDGILETRTVQTGQYVQVGTVLATLVRRDPLLLKFQVPEPDAARLSVGGTARFRLRGDAEPHHAKITHVASAADPTSRMVQVTAQIEGDDKDDLRPGAFAEVTVPIGEQASPVVPVTAVRPSERGFLAFVVNGTTAQERVLTLGLRTADGMVEVREGITPGEQVVVRGAEALKDGATVRIANGGAPVAGSPPAADAGGGARPGGRP